MPRILQRIIDVMKSKTKTWLTNLANGRIKTKTDRVLNMLYNNQNGITIHDLREWLDMPHQTVTAIISQIEDEGLIEVIGEINIGNSYYSIFRFVSDEKKRNQLRSNRQADKVIQWLKKGYNEYASYLPLALYYELDNFLNNDKWKTN